MSDDQQPEDQQLQEAYARLGTALLPPPDVAGRVEREVAARRRHRRTAWASAAVLVVAGTVGGAVALGSGDDQDGDTVAVDVPGAEGSFLLTRQDGSAVEFHDLTLSCDTTPLGDPAAAGTMYLSSPFHVDASGDKLTEPYFFVEVAVDKADGKTFTLPFEDEAGPHRDPSMIVFAAEADPGDGSRANEVSSVQPGAAGTVTVRRASCDPTPTLQVEVDTTLGSEMNKGTEKLVGSFG
jgi:hypothetical protein